MSEELSELSREDFVRARAQYQRDATKAENGPAAELASETQATERDGSFMLYSPGPGSTFAVFEDDTETGWFYLYEATQQKILKAVHIYERSLVTIDEDIVDMGWAVNGSVCGLAIWGEFRAFLGVTNGVQLLKVLKDSEERGIPVSEWPTGFEHYQEKTLD